MPHSSQRARGTRSRTTETVSCSSSAAACRRSRTTTRSSSSVTRMAVTAPRMIFLGFGKWARADRIYALEPLEGPDRGHGRRTRVWVEGLPEPIVASRTERTILTEMGQDASELSPLLDDALDLAERLAAAVEEGRVDLGDLGRRARRVLERTARPPEPEQLF